jgi:rfaE bifunctional protein kinase chain/domain
VSTKDTKAERRKSERRDPASKVTRATKIAKAIDRKRIAASRVLVVGDVMLDRYWFGEVERISPEAPVPVVHVARQEDRLGGAANVAKNVAALGGKVGLLSVVGHDEPGERVAALLDESGIASHLHRDTKLPTTIKLRVIGRQQQLVRVDFEDVPSREVLADKLEQFAMLLASYDIVILSDYGKGGLTHIGRMIEAARREGKRVLIDPKGDDYARYEGASILTPNRAELRQVIGRWLDEDDLAVRAGRLIEQLDLEALLLTRAEEGMTLFQRKAGKIARHDVPAQAREVFDVTGAGDTVIATLAAVLAAGVPMRDAVDVANRAGGIVVGKFGTSVVTPEELFG